MKDCQVSFLAVLMRYGCNVLCCWFGKPDICFILSGSYEWASGEPFDPQSGQYSNWDPNHLLSLNDKDCVALNVSNNFGWVETQCNERHGFVCQKPLGKLMNLLLSGRVCS